MKCISSLKLRKDKVNKDIEVKHLNQNLGEGFFFMLDMISLHIWKHLGKYFYSY